MSLLKTNAVQIGQSATATQNFTLSVPSSPDGTIKLARGNNGATTADIFTVSNSGVVTFANNIVQPSTSTDNICGAYRIGNQSINTNVWNKVMLNSVAVDTGSFFDSTTNYRFQPTVAGYYQVYANIGFSSSGAGQRVVNIYKNGSSFRMLSQGPAINGTGTLIGGSAIIGFNGSSDYVELWGYQDSTATQVIFTAAFEAFFLRS